MRVEEPLIPSFFSSSPSLTPSKSRSTIKALKSFPSIWAKTMNRSAKPALVIHSFSPLRTQCFPSSLKTAVLLAASASDPELASVKA